MSQPANYFSHASAPPILCLLVDDYVFEVGEPNCKPRTRYPGQFVPLAPIVTVSPLAAIAAELIASLDLEGDELAGFALHISANGKRGERSNTLAVTHGYGSPTYVATLDASLAATEAHGGFYEHHATGDSTDTAAAAMVAAFRHWRATGQYEATVSK